MSLAIITRYLGPTNHRGSRVQAKCDLGTSTIPWDYAHDAAENHLLAARVLAAKKGLCAHWHMGTFGDRFVFLPKVLP